MRKRIQTKPARVGPRPSPLRGAAPFFLTGSQWKSLAVGFAGAIAVHGFLLAVLPERISPPGQAEDRTNHRLNVTLAAPEDDAPDPPPEEYVATNPDVPSNTPDDTRHFASRDQQAAQEEAPEDEAPEDTPRVEGEELRSQNIVEGHPDPALPSGIFEQRDEQVFADGFPAIPERRPVPGFETDEPDPDESGVHIASNETEDDPGDDAERIVGIDVPEEQRQEGADSGAYASVERPVPEPRPTLPRTHSAPVAEREGNTSRVGTISIDARRSEFGTYIERMMEAVERQWHSLARTHYSISDTGSRVRIRFELDSAGNVSILDIDSSAGDTGTLICMDAIESRAPFGNWSDEMIEVLGDDQTMTITFHYR